MNTLKNEIDGRTHLKVLRYSLHNRVEFKSLLQMLQIYANWNYIFGITSTINKDLRN